MAGWLLSLVLVVLDRVQAQGQLSNIARRDRGDRRRVSPRDWCRPGARSHGPLELAFVPLLRFSRNNCLRLDYYAPVLSRG